MAHKNIKRYAKQHHECIIILYRMYEEENERKKNCYVYIAQLIA